MWQPSTFYFLLLYTSFGFRKAGDAAGSTGGTQREKFVNLFQLEAGFLADDAHHRGKTFFLIVLADNADYFPMVLRQVLNVIGFGDNCRHFVVP